MDSGQSIQSLNIRRFELVSIAQEQKGEIDRTGDELAVGGKVQNLMSGQFDLKFGFGESLIEEFIPRENTLGIWGLLHVNDYIQFCRHIG